MRAVRKKTPFVRKLSERGPAFVILNNAKFAKRRYFWTFQEDIDT